MAKPTKQAQATAGRQTRPKHTEACIVCGHERSQGIHIFGQFLCMDCEQEIVKSEVEDVRYRHYVECMKRIWLAAIS